MDYSPMSLSSVVTKVVERIMVEVVTRHLDDSHLLSFHHFGFKLGWSTSDLPLLLSRSWQYALNGYGYRSP